MIIDYGIEWSDDYQIIGLDEVMIISMTGSLAILMQENSALLLHVLQSKQLAHFWLRNLRRFDRIGFRCLQAQRIIKSDGRAT